MAGSDERSRQVAQYWASSFGDDYTERNAATEEAVQVRVRGLMRIWATLQGDPPKSILECGSNLGLNLRAFRRFTQADLYAIEPNASAREKVVQDAILPADRMIEGTLDHLPFGNGSVDLVFTSGVLIHVPPDRLLRACQEVHRVSGKYVLAMEYFAQNPETIPYRGQTELLFKRDFGGFYLDNFPDLVPIAEGFLWKRTTGFDDATWWLFRKRGA